MKKLLLTLVTLLSAIATQAQESTYQPLVREGVRWHYVKQTVDMDINVCNSELYYYEFKGDSIINGNVYKKCFRTKIDGNKCETSLADLMYEKEKIVYSLYTWLEKEKTEFGYLIYDFNAPQGMLIGTIDVAGHQCKKYEISLDDEQIELIESVGYEYPYGSGVFGDLVNPFLQMASGDRLTDYHLDYIDDINGNVIYSSNEYPWATDVNRDSRTDISDLNIVINSILNLGCTGNNKIASDIDKDGKTDVADVNAVINAILGIN